MTKQMMTIAILVVMLMSSSPTCTSSTANYILANTADIQIQTEHLYVISFFSWRLVFLVQ